MLADMRQDMIKPYDLETALRHFKTDRDVFHVAEVALVETANGLERIASDEHSSGEWPVPAFEVIAGQTLQAPGKFGHAVVVKDVGRQLEPGVAGLAAGCRLPCQST